MEIDDLNWVIKFMYSGREGIIVDKSLIQRLGLHEAIVLCELINKYDEVKDYDVVVQKGSFFYTIADMKSNTGLTRYYQDKAIAKLSNKKLIEQWSEGALINEQRRWFKINFENVKRFICQPLALDGQKNE